MSQFEAPLGSTDPFTTAVARHLRIGTDFPEQNTEGFVLKSHGPDSPAKFESLGTLPPGPHVLATTTALGPEHTVSGLTAGQVLKATGATTAAFQALTAADITGGTFGRAQLPPQVAYEDEANTFTLAQTFSATAAFNGAPPFTVTSTALVPNLNADLLDGQHGAYYLDRANHTGVIGKAALPATIAYEDEANIFTLANTFQADLIVKSSGTLRTDLGTAATPVVHQTLRTTGGLARFGFALTGTESGSNAGSDFQIRYYDDAGATLGPALEITRSTGSVRFYQQANFMSSSAPFTVGNSLLVANLNADYLDGQHGSYYLDLANHTGTITRAMLPSQIAYEDEANTFTQSNTFSGPQTTVTVQGTTAATSITFRIVPFADTHHALRVDSTGAVPRHALRGDGTAYLSSGAGSTIIGTDPGAGETLRVGTTVRIGNTSSTVLGAALTLASTAASGANVQMIAGGRIDMAWYDSAAALDEKHWILSIDGVGGAKSFSFGIRNDAGSAGNQWLRAYRTANAIDRVEITTSLVSVALDTGAFYPLIGTPTLGKLAAPFGRMFSQGLTLTGPAGTTLRITSNSGIGPSVYITPFADTDQALRISNAADSTTRHDLRGDGSAYLSSGAGATIIGTDPGSSAILRVGGAINLSTGNGYFIGGTQRVLDSGNYTTLHDPTGSTRVWLGKTPDPAIYLNSDNFWFRDTTSVVTMQLTNSGGMGELRLTNDGLGLRLTAKTATGSPYMAWYDSSSVRLGFIQLDSGSDNMYISSDAGYVSFYTGGVQRWRIDSSVSGTLGALVPASDISYNLGSASLRMNGVWTRVLLMYDNVTSGNPYISWSWNNGSGTNRAGYLEGTGDLLRVYSSTLGNGCMYWNFATGLSATYGDLQVGSLGIFNSAIAPVNDYVLAYNSSAGKWQPKAIDAIAVPYPPVRMANFGAPLNITTTINTQFAAFTIPANILSQNGHSARFVASGTMTTQRGAVRLEIASTLAFDSGFISAGHVWWMEVIFWRKDASNCRVVVHWSSGTSGGAFAVDSITTITIGISTWTGSQTIAAYGRTETSGGTCAVDGSYMYVNTL